MSPDTYDFLMIMAIFLFSLSIFGLLTCAFLRILKEFHNTREKIMQREYLETVDRR